MYFCKHNELFGVHALLDKVAAQTLLFTPPGHCFCYAFRADSLPVLDSGRSPATGTEHSGASSYFDPLLLHAPVCNWLFLVLDWYFHL